MGVRFGISIPPVATALADVLDMTRAAEDEGLDLVGIQDHPYAPEHGDAFGVLGPALAATNRITLYSGIATMPLRRPSMLAEQAATLDLISGGRFELGVGTGAFEEGALALGGPRSRGAAALRALSEGMEIIRSAWRPGQVVTVRGTEYTVAGLPGGPAPAHRMALWLGAIGPRALDLIGRAADGWVAPLPAWLPWEQWRNAQDRIDSAALAAGRDPRAITRMAALPGEIGDRALHPRPRGADPIRGSAAEWAEIIAALHRNARFDTFIFWPPSLDVDQVRRFARDVVPAVRERLGEVAMAG
ncbi:LLM class flavin-dependent oxidoreductase [Nocardia sp. NPDC005978]|uniref:LLM class flavin-dependent oxidoreductase n=1 Tax=unclassified Nocardia TaxID=2637762 RepID=UPI0033AE38FA